MYSVHIHLCINAYCPLTIAYCPMWTPVPMTRRNCRSEKVYSASCSAVRPLRYSLAARRVRENQVGPENKVGAEKKSGPRIRMGPRISLGPGIRWGPERWGRLCKINKIKMIAYCLLIAYALLPEIDSLRWLSVHKVKMRNITMHLNCIHSLMVQGLSQDNNNNTW